VGPAFRRLPALSRLANELIRRLSGELPADFAKRPAYIAEVAAKGETIASRKASQNA
jgi:transketolase